MTLREELAADVAALEPEIGATFAWNGNDYPCLNGSTRRRKGLDSGGWGLDADLVLFVRSDHFADAAARPQLKQAITFEARSYRIEEIVTPAGTPFLKLICADAARAL